MSLLMKRKFAQTLKSLKILWTWLQATASMLDSTNCWKLIKSIWTNLERRRWGQKDSEVTFRVWRRCVMPRQPCWVRLANSWNDNISIRQEVPMMWQKPLGRQQVRICHVPLELELFDLRGVDHYTERL